MKNLLLMGAFAIGMVVQAQVSMDLPSISKIMVDDASSVEIRYGLSNKIQYSGSEEEFNDLVKATSGSLIIKGSAKMDSNKRIRIYLRDFSGIQVSGNSNVTVEGFKILERLNISAKDNAVLDMGTTPINKLMIDQEGSSTVTADGAKSTTLIKDGMLTTAN